MLHAVNCAPWFCKERWKLARKDWNYNHKTPKSLAPLLHGMPHGQVVVDNVPFPGLNLRDGNYFQLFQHQTFTRFTVTCISSWVYTGWQKHACRKNPLLACICHLWLVESRIWPPAELSTFYSGIAQWLSGDSPHSMRTLQGLVRYGEESRVASRQCIWPVGQQAEDKTRTVQRLCSYSSCWKGVTAPCSQLTT